MPKKPTLTALTLTPKQRKDAAKAIGDLLHVLNQLPTYIGDFIGNREDLENIYRSQALLRGEEYDPSDYFDDDEEDE